MKKPYVIGITGGSGSGKTTFIKKLMKGFSDKQLCLVSQDDYYKPREKQKTDAMGIKNFDLPRSIARKEFESELKELTEGKTIYRKEYVFNNELMEPKMITYKPAPIILVEGLFVFHFKKIFNLFDLKICIDAREDLKIIRRIKRDKTERNYPLEDVLYRYEHHVSPAYDKYIKPYKEKADLIVNNHESFDRGLEVVRGFLKYKLKKI